MYVPDLAVATARRVAEHRRRGGHVLVGDPGRPTRQAFLDELRRQLSEELSGGVPVPVAFTRAQEAPRLARDATQPELRLLLFDEHCRPPFYGRV